MLSNQHKYFRLLHNLAQTILDRRLSHPKKIQSISGIIVSTVNSLQEPIGDLVKSPLVYFSQCDDSGYSGHVATLTDIRSIIWV